MEKLFQQILYKRGMKHHRPLFHKANWNRPYHAMGQTLFYRAMSNALYFPIEQWTRHYFNNNMIGGMVGGAVMSSMLNPLSVIRFQCWLHHTTFSTEVSNLWKGRGFKNFSKGLVATLIRDIVFGGVYSSTRHWTFFGCLDHDESGYNYAQEFVWNGASALVATTASSPFNYIRNIQFATPSNEIPLTMWELTKQISNGFRQTRGIKNKFDFLQIRFKFGWGTLRVGLGMALGSQAYEYCLRTIPQF